MVPRKSEKPTILHTGKDVGTPVQPWTRRKTFHIFLIINLCKMYYYSHITGEEIEQRKLYHLPKITQIRSDEAFKLKDLAPESVILNNRHQHVSMLGRMQSSTLEI